MAVRGVLHHRERMTASCPFMRGGIHLAIDPEFQKKRKKVGKEEGIAIWGPVDPPEKLGIRGTYVAVDWDTCEGCGTCFEVCPVQMYEWMETPGHPTSEDKAFPSRELDCVQCYACETECPAQAIRITFPGPVKIWDTVAVMVMFMQIIGGALYGVISGPFLGLIFLSYLGWFVLAVALFLFFSPAMYYPKAGKPGTGKGLMDTTVVVDRGTYGIVRHPQILSCILLISSSILISQHWLSALIGVLLIVWFYVETAKEEKGLVLKFGDDYKRYMEKVPRMNFLVGLIRRLRRGRRV